jgi:uncharacterized phage-associated protein
MYNAVDVAIELLRVARKHAKPLTQMQLQKLVYVAHGLSLAKRNLPMIREQVNAWQYGPVIPEIYHRFKAYGANDINFADLPESKEADNFDKESRDILEEVVNAFAHYSGGQLSELSHRQGSPWHKVWFDSRGNEVRGAIINNDLIKTHYNQALLKGELECL